MTHTAQLRRYAFFAAAKREYLTAGRWLLKVVIQDGFTALDCANLAYVAFNYCDRSFCATLLEKLQQAGIDQAEEIPAIHLYLSLLIDQDEAGVEYLVREKYVDRIVVPTVVRHPERPLVFWHIPKCSGTSINEAVGSWYYDTPINNILPGYGYKPLVSMLISKFMGEVPFLPSMHFGVEELPSVDGCIQCTVLRDPVERAISMYRQEIATNRLQDSDYWHHFRALPRYGAFWDYREDRSFEDWLTNIPRWLLLRQLTTFSRAEVAEVALERLKKLDYVLFRGRGLGSQEDLLSVLGVEPGRVAVAPDLNRSDASIPVAKKAREALAERLAPEYSLLSRFGA